jgi:hypothetical protein
MAAADGVASGAALAPTSRERMCRLVRPARSFNRVVAILAIGLPTPR